MLLEHECAIILASLDYLIMEREIPVLTFYFYSLPPITQQVITRAHTICTTSYNADELDWFCNADHNKSAVQFDHVFARVCDLALEIRGATLLDIAMAIQFFQARSWFIPRLELVKVYNYLKWRHVLHGVYY